MKNRSNPPVRYLENQRDSRDAPSQCFFGLTETGKKVFWVTPSNLVVVEKKRKKVKKRGILERSLGKNPKLKKKKRVGGPPGPRTRKKIFRLPNTTKKKCAQ